MIDKAKAAWEVVKKRLVTAPILAYPDYSKPFKLCGRIKGIWIRDSNSPSPRWSPATDPIPLAMLETEREKVLGDRIGNGGISMGIAESTT